MAGMWLLLAFTIAALMPETIGSGSPESRSHPGSSDPEYMAVVQKEEHKEGEEEKGRWDAASAVRNMRSYCACIAMVC